MRRQTPARSARAAKAVLESDKRFGSVGFGGFSGSKEIDAAAYTDLLSLRGEYQALLKQLTKRNAVTKLKALQRLEELLAVDTVEGVSKVLGQWTVSYGPLTNDVDRSVRLKTAEIMDLFVRRLKRELAPFLKRLIGPWWSAQHDMHSPIAQKSRSTFQEAFSGAKAKEVAVFCRQELTCHLTSAIQATPDTVGNSASDHQSLGELPSRLHCLERRANKSGSSEAVQDCVREISRVAVDKVLLKWLFSRPIAAVRSEAYALIQQVCGLDRALVTERVSAVAPVVFHVLSEKDPICHSSMWNLLLTWARDFPDAWEYVRVEKVVLPKLLAFLRHGGFGSTQQSCAAVVPFLSQIPSEEWKGSPSFLIKVFEAAWEGLRFSVRAGDASETATLTLVRDCVLWGLLTAAGRFAKESEVTFRGELLSATFQTVLPQAISPQNDRELSGAKFLASCLCSLAAADSADKAMTQCCQMLLRDLRQRWENHGRAEETLAAVIRLLERILVHEDATEETQNCVLRSLAFPLGVEWTKQMLSGGKDGSLFAASLLKCSRLFSTSLVGLGEALPEESWTLQIFARLLRNVEEGEPLSGSASYIDLLIWTMNQKPTDARLTDWESVAKKVQCLTQSDLSGTTDLWLSVLKRLDYMHCTEPLKELKSDAVEALCQIYLDRWPLDLPAAEIVSHVIRLQSLILRPGLYSRVLHSFQSLLSDSSLEFSAEGMAAAMSAVFTAAAVKDLSSQLRDLWVKVATELYFCSGSLGPCPEVISASVQRAWRNGKCLEGMEPAVREALSLALQDRYLCLVCNDIPDSAGSAERGTMFGSWACDLVKLPDIDRNEFLKRLFGDGSWCTKWMPQPRAAISARTERLTIVAARLIDVFGASVFRDLPQIRGPIFLEVFSREIANAEIVDEVLDGINQAAGSSFMEELIQRDLSASIEKPAKATVGHLSKSLVEGLVERAENQTAMLAVDQIMASLLPHITELADNDANCMNEVSLPWSAWCAETRLGRLYHSVWPLLNTLSPVIRGCSMLSVMNSELDRVSLLLMDGYTRRAENPMDSRHPERAIADCIKACFPVPDDPAEATKTHLHATPAERDALLEVTLSLGVDADWRHVKTDMWRRRLLYCTSEFRSRHWKGLLSEAASNLQKSAIKCEDFCEFLAEQFTEHVQKLSAATDAISPRVALLSARKLVDQLRIEELDLGVAEASEMQSWVRDFGDWAGVVWTARSYPESDHWSPELAQKFRQSVQHAARFVYCFRICCALTRDTQSLSDVYTIFGHFCERTEFTWATLERLFAMACEEQAFMRDILDGIDLWADSTGVDAPTALLNMSFPETRGELSFRSLGLKQLAVPDCLSELVPEVPFSEESWETYLLQNGSARMADTLIFGGIHPEFAYMLETLQSEDLLLAWGLLLANLESGSASHRSHTVAFLRKLPSLIHGVLNALLDLLPLPQARISEAAQVEQKRQMEREVMHRETFSLRELLQSVGVPQSDNEWHVVAAKIYRLMLTTFPVSVRLWFNDLKQKDLIQAIQQYTGRCESPELIAREFRQLSAGQTSDIKVRSNAARREVVAILEIEDANAIELTIRIPDCTPLKPVTAEYGGKVQLASARTRQWLFSVSSFLSSHSGSVMDAISLWSRNLGDLKNSERCIICFCFVHPGTRKTPNLTCATCRQNFHSACLYTWFRQSSKSLCPHCQSAWTTGA